MKVQCNQSNVCSYRDTCPGAKPHDADDCVVCHVDALADCVPIIEDGFDSEADLKQCCQSGNEMGNIKKITIWDKNFRRELIDGGIDPETITPITKETIDKIRKLTEGVEVDLDKPLNPEDD